MRTDYLPVLCKTGLAWAQTHRLRHRHRLGRCPMEQSGKQIHPIGEKELHKSRHGMEHPYGSRLVLRGTEYIRMCRNSCSSSAPCTTMTVSPQATGEGLGFFLARHNLRLCCSEEASDCHRCRGPCCSHAEQSLLGRSQHSLPRTCATAPESSQ